MRYNKIQAKVTHWRKFLSKNVHLTFCTWCCKPWIFSQEPASVFSRHVMVLTFKQKCVALCFKNIQTHDMLESQPFAFGSDAGYTGMCIYSLKTWKKVFKTKITFIHKTWDAWVGVFAFGSIACNTACVSETLRHEKKTQSLHIYHDLYHLLSVRKRGIITFVAERNTRSFAHKSELRSKS